MTWNCEIALKLERYRAEAWEILQALNNVYTKIEEFGIDLSHDTELDFTQVNTITYASNTVFPALTEIRRTLIGGIDADIVLCDISGCSLTRIDGRSVTSTMLTFSKCKTFRDAYDLGFKIRVRNSNDELEPLSLEEIEMLSRFLDGAK